MKTIRVFIERGNDGNYSAYIPDDNDIPFGATGEGASPKEAQNDFLNVVDAFREDFPEVVPNLQFDFAYDIPSFLRYYSGKLTLAGLSRITGVAQGQLSHYMTGRRRPSSQTVERISSSLHAFGNDLSQVHFAAPHQSPR